MLPVYDFLLSVYDTGHAVFYFATYVVAVFLLWNGIEDLAVDFYYWIHTIFFPKWIEQLRGLPPSKLHTTPEKPIAVFVPAWHESAVIGHMLERACSTIHYKAYDIFVGVYPNDPETVEAVNAVSKRFPQVHAVIGPNPGPSTKADNLNQIHQGMRQYENQTGIRYDIILMHDSEDIIHPMSLKIVNHFVPEYDMVQLPVFPLEVPQREVVAWTYADEFAENHLKDLVVRQHFVGFVPSAGVGTGYNRWLIEFIGTSFAKNMFARASLTEDYDIALRLAMGKAKILFLHQPFGLEVATRAYFPETFTAAVRQKTRWLIGICLQSWKNYGWMGDWKFKFSLYRDRKAVLSNLVTMLAYVVLFLFFALELLRWVLEEYHELDPIIRPYTVLWYIGLVTTTLMIWRAVHRFYFVSHVYGWFAGLMGVLRLPVSNIVNFMAAFRAVKQYFHATRENQPLKWDKTEHSFPTVHGAVGATRNAFKSKQVA
ncbi:MAG: phage adsorption protein NrfB [Bacteroidetes bacterium]|jgi:adsorption protein B|nr:phage adsorption protein NrfB [Bacteroidota bacterium]